MAQTEAEKLAYARGYHAGKKRLLRDVSADRRRRKEDAFWQRAFLAALPAHITSDGWMHGDVPMRIVWETIQS